MDLKQKRGSGERIQATKEKKVSFKRKLRSAHQQENDCALRVTQGDEKVGSNALSSGRDELRMLTTLYQVLFLLPLIQLFIDSLQNAQYHFKLYFLPLVYSALLKGKDGEEGWETKSIRNKVSLDSYLIKVK